MSTFVNKAAYKCNGKTESNTQQNAAQIFEYENSHLESDQKCKLKCFSS